MNCHFYVIIQMSSIFDQLRNAAHAYYETAEPLMTDEAYDVLVEQARSKDPTNAFFTQVGSVPVTGRVPLPCAMPSLKKVKPDSLGSWKKTGPYVLSDKLDGISALWVCGFNQKPALYLRGNGHGNLFMAKALVLMLVVQNYIYQTIAGSN